jgi:hypothetical protein
MRTGHKKERPSGIYIQNNTGANESKEQAYEFVPAANLPDLLFFLKFTHTANILIGAPDIDTSRVEPWILAGRGAFVGKNGWVVGKFDAFSFARMLAKIGHSFAKAEMGAKTFAPIALDFMFGRTKNLSYIVGGSADIDAPSSSLHWLRLRDHFDYSTKRRFLVSHIRLFACLGAPTYHVVVGETAWDSPTLGGDP